MECGDLSPLSFLNSAFSAVCVENQTRLICISDELEWISEGMHRSQII